MGDNETAQQIYERLSRGEPAYATTPTGVPPIGVTNVSSGTKPELQLTGLKGLRTEVAELRKEIRELLEVLRSL